MTAEQAYIEYLEICAAVDFPGTEEEERAARRAAYKRYEAIAEAEARNEGEA